MDPWIKQLPPDLVKKARVELNEIQEEVPNRIQALRDQIQKDPTLNFRTDDAFLLRFLRARKFNQEKALELMKNYYRQRLNYPELYKKLSTSGLNEALASNYQGALFQKDCHGRAVIIFNSLTNWDPPKVSLEDITGNFLLTLECLIESDEVQISGIVCLIDVKGLSVHQVPHVTPSAIRQFFTVTKNAFPIRYKQVHYTNEFKIFDAIFLLFKPFMNRKITSRTFFHGSNMKSLHEHVNPDILPAEFGGLTGPYNNEEWNKALVEHDEVVNNDLIYGFSEK